MKTYDFELDDEEKKTLTESVPSNIETFDFKENMIEDFTFLVKFYAVNRYYSKEGCNMEKLLNDLGFQTRGSNMYCPFHHDELNGKPSAKYHPETDTVYCFSESKVFTAFHVLKDLYGISVDKFFRDVWNRLSDVDKEDIIRKYGDESNVDRKEFINPIWRSLSQVTSQFRQGNVGFRQHKNALYKIMNMVYDSKNTNVEEGLLP
jgi:hypothetical protein